MYRKSILIAFLLILGLGNFSYAQSKKLLEFGWDYPDVDFLYENLDKVQNRPFEGIIFSFNRNIYEIFDTADYSAKTFNQSRLDQLKWGRFTDNFIFTRGYTKTGAQWFNDKAWDKILKNTEALSKAINQKNIKGIIFDAEYYLEDPALDPFKYKPEYYKGKSFTEVYNMVQKRGAQFIQALEKHKPDVKVLSLWMYTLYFDNLNKSIINKSEFRWPLMLPFIEGMMNGKGKGSTIIDGNENAYTYLLNHQYYEVGDGIRDAALRLSGISKRSNKYTVASSIFYDYNFGLNNYPTKDWTKEEQINRFKMTLKESLSGTDEYVWLYSERIDWWRKNENEKMQIIESVKNNLYKPENLSYLNLFVPGEPKDYTKKYPYKAVYNARNKRLTLNIDTKSIKNIHIYKNNTVLYKKTENLKNNLVIDLKKVYDNKGFLNVVVIFTDGGSASNTVYAGTN